MTDANLVSTTRLLEASQAGDDSARNRLFAHCRPLLLRWAHGRIPAFARGLADTEDIVQATLLRASNNLDHFQHRGTGSYLAYLRTSALNAVKEELRRSGRQPECTERFELAGEDTDPVLGNAINTDIVERYEHALQRLSPAQRDAVVLRVEFGLSYAELAVELGAPSDDAARMQVSRALVRLAEIMRT